MTQEDKELLLKDLCGRLNHNLICYIFREDDEVIGWRNDKLVGFFNGKKFYEFYFDDAPLSVDDIQKIKPYLRPMSSMTEEEKEEFDNLYNWSCPNSKFLRTKIIDVSELIDWLNKNHFDYRGLIEKGLALEAKEGMYKIILI